MTVILFKHWEHDNANNHFIEMLSLYLMHYPCLLFVNRYFSLQIVTLKLICVGRIPNAMIGILVTIVNIFKHFFDWNVTSSVY